VVSWRRRDRGTDLAEERDPLIVFMLAIVGRGGASFFGVTTLEVYSD
jgi:hypothetical protein